VYAQAIDRVEGGATRGDEVRVADPRGNFLGRGFYSPGSAIVVRIIVRDETTPIDADLFVKRLTDAHALRTSLGLGPGGDAPRTTGFRLVHAEGDGLPGLVVDRMGEAMVVQFLTFGMKARERVILDALETALGKRTILDRTPASVLKHEGFTPTPGVVRGAAIEELAFEERGFSHTIPTSLGQKTGFYFDQRDLRARVERLSRGARVLDAYAYTAAFGMAAARGGAREVVSVDESALALETAATAARANGVHGAMKFVVADARRVMQEAHGAFDLVVCDPPRLAPTRTQREQALVHYARLAELSCRAVRPGGLVVVCSCSAAVDLAALTRAVATGAQRANVSCAVLERHFQGPDHPVLAAFPEGLYLKAVLARVTPR
jgi:23S rRNA (cytosine1962-C5)-methyltransferase